ncbi:MAG: phytanoyl-CoA dioxygenase family protein [Chloroflexota bacterium]
MNHTINPTFQGRLLDMSPQAFGALRASDSTLDSVTELRQRFDEDGYLYLPSLLHRDKVMAARLAALSRLDELGHLDPAHPVSEGVAAAEYDGAFMPELAQENPAVLKILYTGPMMDFYERFFGGPVRHFDYTWCRAKAPGDSTATSPHCDIVFMGRGTNKLCTSWTPLGDVPLLMGGLMILENSHRLDGLKSTYGQLDVDLYCTNYPDATEIESGKKQWQHPQGGSYSHDAIATRSEFGRRWLTADYKMGDVLIFSMYTMHASMDNQTNHIRISTDTRYQLASEPVDERWIGENPIAHGLESKIGMIC